MITAVNRPAALHINLAAIKENTRQAKAHLKPAIYAVPSPSLPARFSKNSRPG